jgi:hypothetical protein
MENLTTGERIEQLLDDADIPHIEHDIETVYVTFGGDEDTHAVVTQILTDNNITATIVKEYDDADMGWTVYTIEFTP